MDIELTFIASLLSASRNDQRKFFALNIPLGVFSAREDEMNWIAKFYRTQHECPSIKAFRARFTESNIRRNSRSISATLEPILDAARFEQIKKLTEAVRHKIDGGESMSDIFKYFKSKASTLRDHTSGLTDLNFNKSSGTDQRYRETVALLQKDTGLANSPWPTLNKHFPFAKGGDRLTLAGRGSFGKTWILLCWAEHWAKMGLRTGVFSKEMPVDDMEDRLDSLRYSFSYPDLISGTLRPRVLRAFRDAKAADANKENMLFLFGNTSEASITLETVVSKIREYSLDAVWVDGIYLIRPTELPANVSDTQRLTYLSNRSKEIATGLNVIFGATIQDNRSAEDKTGNSRGGATTAFGSDAWFQDSDLMTHIGGNRTADHRELIFSKIRKAPLFDMAINFSLTPPNFADKGIPLAKPADAAKQAKQGKDLFKSKTVK